MSIKVVKYTSKHIFKNPWKRTKEYVRKSCPGLPTNRSLRNNPLLLLAIPLSLIFKYKPPPQPAWARADGQ
jgi:hypothetical protein